ncbi:MAG: ACT domain-containing protein, partial [Pseudonocardiaceae bacterium]
AGVVGEEVRPWLPLTQKLGTVLATLTARTPDSVTVDVRGELAAEDVSVLQLAALRGIFTGVVDEQVTFVNAPRLAQERGVAITVVTASESPSHRSVVRVRGAFADGTVSSVSGTLSGPAQVQKLVEIDGRHFDMRAQGEAIFMEYPDRPGVMGTVGMLLGGAGVNIEAAQISQTTAGTDAIMMLRVDQSVPKDVLDAIGPSVGARTVRSVTFG